MKIGIVTQPLSCNYGGILQTYALQEKLRSLGHDPITFLYNRHTWFWWIKNSILVTMLKMLGKRVEYYPSPSKVRSNNRGFRKFISEHISCSKEFSSYKSSLCAGLDAIVVGSDQVWRPMYNKYSLPDMFLRFTHTSQITRLSYAASLGTDRWEFSPEQTKVCSTLLSKFNAVSVREDSGVSLCEQYLNYPNAHHVLDPTLLLSRSHYLSLCKNVPVSSSSFIFVYLLDRTPEKTKFINEIAKNKNLSVLFLSADEKVKSTDTIEGWLSMFRDAKYVITDSFHGTVFSIIFHRDFNVFCNQSRGNARIDSLLKLFALENRLITDNVNLECIDWTSVDDVLNVNKEKSIRFLQSNLV